MNVKKMFCSVTDEKAKQARMVIPGKPIQPRFIFTSKAGAYLSGAPSFLGRLLGAVFTTLHFFVTYKWAH
jgi:hypothetical protein